MKLQGALLTIHTSWIFNKYYVVVPLPFSLSYFDSVLLCDGSSPLDWRPCSLLELLEPRSAILELCSAELKSCSAVLTPCCLVARFSLFSLEATVHEPSLLTNLVSVLPYMIGAVTLGVSSAVLAEDKTETTRSDIVVLLDVVLELPPISFASISSDKPVCRKSKYSHRQVYIVIDLLENR